MDSTIIITGASGGLGKTVTSLLVKQKHNVKAIVNPIHKNKKDLFPDDLEKSKNFTKSFLDVLNDKEVAKYMKQEKNIRAGLLLVGGFKEGDFSHTTGEQIDYLINLNFKSAFFMSKYLIPEFKKRNEGLLVLISSMPAVENKGKGIFAYTLAKKMILNLADILQEELKGTHVKIAVIAPDTIATPGNIQSMPGEDHSKWIQPEEIGELILYLLKENSKNLKTRVFKMYGSVN
ncbi:MAG: SDR family oxidoreductase [bacterium]